MIGIDFNCLCPCFFHVRRTSGRVFKIKKRPGQQVGGSQASTSQYVLPTAIFWKKTESPFIAAVFFWNVMFLLAYICVIKKKNDGLLSWLGRASVLISLINYYTIR